MNPVVSMSLCLIHPNPFACSFTIFLASLWTQDDIDLYLQSVHVKFFFFFFFFLPFFSSCFHGLISQPVPCYISWSNAV